MDKMKMQTSNIVDENVGFIESRFPNCIVEARDEDGNLKKMVDFDMLKQELSQVVVDGDKERYQMTWPDKRKAILTANAPINATLRPCREESVDFDNTKNLYIEGDNLDVLKLLRETYLGKVDVIYIDPPYNTGFSLIYNNDFHDTVDEFIKANDYDESGNRLIVNSNTNGRYHTNWLNMMYPRLKVAKDLLNDSGIIVLTIDDYEINTLTTMCNEIFGEDNHMGTVVIKNNPSGRSTVKGFSVNHEYALFYAKSQSASLGRLKHSNAQKSRYKEKDNFGYFEWENFRKNGTDSDRKDRPKQFYPIGINLFDDSLFIPNVKWDDNNKSYIVLDDLSENVKLLYPISQNGLEKVWKYGIERTKEIINDILVKHTIDGVELYRKKYINEEGTLPHTWWDKPDYSARDNGTRTLTNIFGPAKLFDFPKAPEAVKDALLSANVGESGLVLDFFSGSSTTAQAVLELNEEDGGNRKFIMIQLPEVCDEKSEAFKAGYNNICEIGKERIRRAGKKIKEEGGLATQDLDIGFRVFKLDSSNMKDTYYSPSEYDMSLLDTLDENIKSDRTPEDLLFQVMLDLGLMLDSKIETKQINGKKVFIVGDYNEAVHPDLVCCFDSDVSNDTVTEIAKMKPKYAVFRDSSMSTDSVAVNFDQLFETYSPSTTRKVL